jgi:OOP family OmpA-OmpF porin
VNTIRRTLLLALAVGASPFLASPAASQGYWVDGRGGVLTDAYNLCWRAGSWTPALATAECDPELVPRAAPPPPPPPPAAKPAPPPPPPPPPAAKPAPAPAPKPAMKTLTVQSTELFEFDKATLTADAKNKLDQELVGRLKEFESIKLIIVSGYADRIGDQQYNQKLSERRAETVKAYLVSKGVNGNLVETIGFGKTLQIKSCPDPSPKGEIKTFKQLVDCLAPNRRAVVEIQGAPR